MMGDAMATMQTVVTWRRWRRDGTADSGRVVGECQLGVAWCIDTHESRGNTRQAADERQRRDPETQRRTQKAAGAKNSERRWTQESGGSERVRRRRWHHQTSGVDCGGGARIARE
jgi:hypothetical protein